MRIIKDKFFWIDILKPGVNDLAFLETIEKFHPLILEELTGPSARSFAERHERYLFLVYHLPLYSQEKKSSERAEVDFLITKERVITVHFEPLPQLEEFAAVLSAKEHLKERVLGHSTGELLYYLLQYFNDFALRQLAHIDDDIDYISQNIFSRREQEILEKISYVKRNLVNFKLVVDPQVILLNSLKEAAEKFWPAASQELTPYFNDLIGDHSRVMQKLENNYQIIEALEKTNSQLLTTKTNNTMKTLSILALFTFPLALYTAVYDIAQGRDLIDYIFGSFWSGFFIFLLLTFLAIWLTERK